MRDIVERLRELSKNCLKLEAAGGNEGAWLQIAGIQKDAAAEIERLRGLIFDGAAIWKPSHPPSSLTWQCDLEEWLSWLEKVDAIREAPGDGEAA